MRSVQKTINTPRIQNIVQLVNQLSEQAQSELENQLSYFVMSLKADSLSQSVKKHTITMSDIVAEVKKQRNAQ